MTQLSAARLDTITRQFPNLTIATVGDIIVDEYLVGVSRRISAEAPVPIVEVQERYVNLGGAANVASNVKSLTAHSLLLGVLGDDVSAVRATSKFEEMDISTECILCNPGHPTTTKLRLIANGQQIGRADMESTDPIPDTLQERLLADLRARIQAVDAVIMQDYNKGLLGPDLIKNIISLCREHNKIVAVDPKFNNFFDYKGVTLFKPNRREVEDRLGIRIQSEKDIELACTTLIDRLECENVVISLSEDGMALMELNGGYHRLAARVRTVHDTSGAGDTAISTIALSLAAGASPLEAVALGNYAAGAICEKLGVLPVTLEELTDAISYHRSLD